MLLPPWRHMCKPFRHLSLCLLSCSIQQIFQFKNSSSSRALFATRLFRHGLWTGWSASALHQFPHILSGRVSLPARLPLSLSVRQESLAGGALEFALVLHICRLWRQWDSFCVYALLVCSVVFWTDINNFSSFVSVHIVPTYFDSSRLVFLVDYRLHLFLETDDCFVFLYCCGILYFYIETILWLLLDVSPDAFKCVTLFGKIFLFLNVKAYFLILLNSHRL